jgi:hypothetical protein
VVIILNNKHLIATDGTTMLDNTVKRNQGALDSYINDTQTRANNNYKGANGEMMQH